MTLAPEIEIEIFQIPFVKKAEALRPEPLKLFASPWTAPKWMKSNNDLIGLGHLLPEYYQVWADYFVRQAIKIFFLNLTLLS